MKKSILTVLLLILSVVTYAQKKQKDTAKVILPTKGDLIFFETIVDSLSNQSKDILYNKSLKWMADSFVDSKEVIQIKNPEEGSIVGSGLFDYTAPGLLGERERMSFMVEITAKDNKSRIRLYQFKYKTFGSAGYGRASASKDSDYYSIDKRYQAYLNEKQWPKANRAYYQIIKDKVQAIIESYNSFLKNSPVNDDF